MWQFIVSNALIWQLTLKLQEISSCICWKAICCYRCIWTASKHRFLHGKERKQSECAMPWVLPWSLPCWPQPSPSVPAEPQAAGKAGSNPRSPQRSAADCCRQALELALALALELELEQQRVCGAHQRLPSHLPRLGQRLLRLLAYSIATAFYCHSRLKQLLLYQIKQVRNQKDLWWKNCEAFLKQSMTSG